MKLMMLVSRFPYPLEKGDKLRAYHQLKELSKKHEIHLISLTDQTIKEEWLAEIKKHCASVHILKLNRFFIYVNTALQFFSDKPYQVGYFYQGSVQRKINQLIEQLKPEHIYCQLIRTAEYVKHIQHIPKTIDYMDALAKGMMRRADISRGLMKKLFLAEARRLGAYENRIFDYFNHHTIISEQDQKLIQHPEAHRIRVIENGIGEEFLHYNTRQKPEYDLVFVGNLNYPPNIQCAEYLVKEILPKLHREKPEVRVLISGANPNKRVADLAGDYVKVQGWVDDIRSSYCQGKVFVAPLFIGTGLQNKLLEAMALSIPCITTPLANNALRASSGDSIVIAHNAEEFVREIIHLLHSPEYAQKLGAAGKQFVQAKFSWAHSVQKLDELMQSFQNR